MSPEPLPTDNILLKLENVGKFKFTINLHGQDIVLIFLPVYCPIVSGNFLYIQLFIRPCN